MTRTILLAQEFGDGLGHVSRLIEIARELNDHRLVFAVSNEAIAGPAITAAFGSTAEVIGGTGFAGALQSVPDGRPDKTLADVLHRIGYGVPELLARQASKWSDLLARLRPDLIIADFAPTLRLVSCGRVPAVVIGDGFAIPPAGRRLPPIDRSATHPDGVSLAHEKQVLETARRLRKTYGGPRLACVADLFGGERVFPIAFGDCDPYGAIRDLPTVSPFTIPGVTRGPRLPERRGPPVLCFLWRSHPALNTAITALNGLQVRSELHVRGMEAREVAGHCAPHVGVRAEAPRFDHLLPQSGVFVHYGGSGATYAALQAGVMQLILPTNLEQDVTASAMQRLGVAHVARPGPELTPESLRALLAHQTNDRRMHDTVLTVADQERTRRTPDGLAMIRSACRTLLR